MNLREEFPGPECDPGPQLSEQDSSAQVRFDLRQQLRGLPVQPVRVRQHAVIDNLLLRDKRSHVTFYDHIPLFFPPVVSARKMREKTLLSVWLMSASLGESAAEVRGHNPLRPATTERKAGDHWGKVCHAN